MLGHEAKYGIKVEVGSQGSSKTFVFLGSFQWKVDYNSESSEVPWEASCASWYTFPDITLWVFLASPYGYIYLQTFSFIHNIHQSVINVTQQIIKNLMIIISHFKLSFITRLSKFSCRYSEKIITVNLPQKVRKSLI